MELLHSKGYLTTMFRSDEGFNLHFLAQDYDTDIDHGLDDMRFHRSRVNYVNRDVPVNVSRKIVLRATQKPQVFMPFHEDGAEVVFKEGAYEITLPQDTAYAIIQV